MGKIPFKTKDDALDSLVHDLFLMYYEEELRPQQKVRLGKCCKNYKNSNYCPDCGKWMNRTKKFDPEDFAYWIVGLCGRTADDWGGYELNNWWPWDPMEHVVRDYPYQEWVFIEDDYAEEKLAERALQFVPEELKEDGIC
jgi:hypothetical protein